MVWNNLKTTQEKGNNSDLFMFLLENYGVRIFYQEVVNACHAMGTEFLVAPYFSTPQIVYSFKQKHVHAACGSMMCLLYESVSELS